MYKYRNLYTYNSVHFNIYIYINTFIFIYTDIKMNQLIFYSSWCNRYTNQLISPRELVSARGGAPPAFYRQSNRIVFVAEGSSMPNHLHLIGRNIKQHKLLIETQTSIIASLQLSCKAPASCTTGFGKAMEGAWKA